MLNKDEQMERKRILELVSAYAQTFHSEKPYEDGDRICYAKRVYDSSEIVALVESSLDFWLTNGRFSLQFETEFARKIGTNYCTLVNSGSSANLLAFMTLTSPLLKDRSVKRGDEVITVAAGFPTTVAPIVQYGAIPVFIDITIPEYNIDINALEMALSEKTKAVMLAHTLGNPFDLKTVKEFCKKHNLWLIEDNCDALGSKFILDGTEHFTGTIGDIGTSSFYPPHHITMGEGGAVYTDDELLNKIIRSMRDWGRDCSCPSGQDNCCGHRFDRTYGQLPQGYDHKYVYSHFGYNLKATDMQAAIGVAQLKKVDEFTKRRQANFQRLYDGLKDLQDYLILPKAMAHSIPSWFGFLITCKNMIDRNQIICHLEANGIQTRMLFAGNMIKHPCFDEMRKEQNGYRIIDSLDNTNTIMEKRFWLGVYPGMTVPMLDKMIDKIYESVQRQTDFNDH